MRYSYLETFQLENLNGYNGFKLVGNITSAFEFFGSVSMAGDINGDGYGDLVVWYDPYLRGKEASTVLIWGGPEIGKTGLVNLTGLNATDGFRLVDGGQGALNNIDVGHPIAGAGDINGDGYHDLLIGSPRYNNFTGRSYVVFGGPKVDDSSGLLNLSNLNGSNGFKIDGEYDYSFSGFSVDMAEDVNGDGYADFLIGAPGYPPGGRSYVIFGGPDIGKTGLLSLSSLNGTDGFKINGQAISGYSVSSAGDINGDGYTDCLVGAIAYKNYTGCTYVIWGGPQVGRDGLLDLSNLDGGNGFMLEGEKSGAGSSFALSSAGDMNGDGFADLVIGAPYFSNSINKSIGRSYVVFGGPTVGRAGNIRLSNLNGANGFRLDGSAILDMSGIAVSSAGDFNGDGYSDILIGASGYGAKIRTMFSSPGLKSSNIGRTYLVLGGRAIGNYGYLALNDITGANGIQIAGENSYDYSGCSVSGGSDINGDGFPDLFLGLGRNNGIWTEPGTRTATKGYLVFGENTTLPPPRLWLSPLVIHQNQTRILTMEDMNATDINFPEGQLGFNVKNVQFGRFSTIENPIAPIHRFNQTQLKNGEVRLVHDGSRSTPSYTIQADHGGIIASMPQTAPITFYPFDLYCGLVTINPIPSISVTLTALELNVSDGGNNDDIIFTVADSLSSGQWAESIGWFNLATDPQTPIKEFSQLQIKNNQVQLTTSENITGAPEKSYVYINYLIKASNPYYYSLYPAQWLFGGCGIYINHRPYLINNSLAIAPGKTVVLDSTNIWSQDENTPPQELLLTPMNIKHGYFSLKTNSNFPIHYFTQQQIFSGEIQFTADRSWESPAYELTATDKFNLSSSLQPASIAFYPPYRLPLYGVGGIILASAWLLGGGLSWWAKKQRPSEYKNISAFIRLNEVKPVIDEFKKFDLLPSVLILSIAAFLDSATAAALKTTSRHYYGKKPEALQKPCLSHAQEYTQKSVTYYFDTFKYLKKCGLTHREESRLLKLALILPEFILSVPVALFSFAVGGIIDIKNGARRAIRTHCQPERAPPANGFFDWKLFKVNTRRLPEDLILKKINCTK